MKNTINLTINSAEYSAVPIEVAKAIEVMLAQYKTAPKAKAETPKTAPKAKAEPKQYAKLYAVAKDGKSVTIGADGQFIPTKVFKGVTYSLKQAGAKYDSKTKAWTFGTKKACEAWCKAQDARA